MFDENGKLVYTPAPKPQLAPTPAPTPTPQPVQEQPKPFVGTANMVWALTLIDIKGAFFLDQFVVPSR